MISFAYTESRIKMAEQNVPAALRVYYMILAMRISIKAVEAAEAEMEIKSNARLTGVVLLAVEAVA